jgi:cytochrome b pre-mRNA-processing protein 6
MVSAVPPSAASSWNELHELSQTNALYSLLENRYMHENPMPAKLRRPASNPEHYDVLVRELEEAPGRSWLGALVKRVKGSLRFS